MNNPGIAAYAQPPAVAADAPQVADLIVSYLEQLGIEYVFGVPGGNIEPLYNALARSERRGGPRPVLARHESGAAFMADGYARETGKIGVCCATSGPGATNLLTGIACAYENAVPLLAITGQPALPSFGRRALQESTCTGVNVLGMFRHCTRYDSLVSHAGQIENKLAGALMSALGPPRGPVHLSIPVDILRTPIGSMQPAYDLAPLLQPTSLVDDGQLQQLLAAIRQARRPVIVIGGSTACADAADLLVRLAEIAGAPFVTTPDGKGLVDPRHRLYRGVFGFAGHASADALLRSEPDLILAVGTSLGEWTSGGWSASVLNGRLIHLDASGVHLQRSPMARLHVHGDIRAVCERLVNSLLGDDRAGAGVAAIDGNTTDGGGALLEPAKYDSEAVPIKPQRLMRELSQRFPENTRFVADAGNSAAWAIHYLQPAGEGLRNRKDADWLRVLAEFAPMGWAIGAAVGAARGNPEQPVVCITGDGSYLMNGQEISVAVAEGLTVVYVVLNDGALGMVRHGQRLAGAEQVACLLPAVDFARQAEAVGAAGVVIRSPQDMAELDVAAILSRRGPTLLDVRVDGDEVPPIALRMKVLGGGR